MSKKDKQNDYIGVGNIAVENTLIMKNIHSSNNHLKKLSLEISDLVERRANCTVESTGGYVAEVHHARTFEADALRKGYKGIEAKIGPRGGSGSKGTADLTIFDGGEKISEAGLSYRGKANQTTFDQSNVFDNGRQKICPSDQIEEIKRLSKKRADTSTLKAQEYADTAKNTTDKCKYKDIESLPLSKQGSMDTIKNPSKYAVKAFQNDVLQSAKGGAVAGAAIGAAMSISTNTIACINGKKKIGKAARDVVTETATGAVKGAAIGAGSECLRLGLIKAGAKVIAKGSAPAAIVCSTLEAGIGIASEIKKLANGDQDISNFALNSIGHSATAATKGGAAYAGAELGASLGIIGGPIGILVGGMLGGTIGYFACDSILNYTKNSLKSRDIFKFKYIPIANVT